VKKEKSGRLAGFIKHMKLRTRKRTYPFKFYYSEKECIGEFKKHVYPLTGMEDVCMRCGCVRDDGRGRTLKKNK
jgi:hypothetical protein